MVAMSRVMATFDSAALTGSFQNVGSAITFPTLKIAILNTSDVDVLVTDQSSQDDIYIPANATMNIGEGIYLNGRSTETKEIFDTGTQLQIKQVTGAGTGKIIFNILG